MRHRILAALVLAGLATPAQAAPSAYSIAFVSEFAEACVPGRLGYESTQAAVVAAGWTELPRGSNAELDAMMAMSEAAAADPEVKATFTYTTYQKSIDGQPHHLVVSLSSAVISEPDDPWVNVGCYLYNLDAKEPIDPEPITALTGNPIANAREQDGAVAYIWGPPCPMPRTGDTYLSFVPESSSVAGESPFTGLALNFSTSVPDPGEVVPDTYC